MADSVLFDPASQQVASYPTVAASSILSRLRAETREEHKAVELVLDMMSTTLTQQSYRHQLQQFYGFYAPLEKALKVFGRQRTIGCQNTHLPAAISAALIARLNKTAHLQQDLECLGVGTAGLALCRALPPIRTQSEILGCLYVMEGATLGGRLITRHVRAALGVTPITGGRFFEGYGEDTGRMWQGMRQLLVEGSPDTATENSIVTNAITTFACLRGWCETFPETNKNGTTLHA